MPVPRELTPFFTSLVEKSKRSEVNWEASGKPDCFHVRFPDFSITASQENAKAPVVIHLVNDDGNPTAVITVDQNDEEWLGAVALINSADRKVKKISQTLKRAMEELGRDGPIGIGPPS